jgi:hypothetical protein
MRCWNTLIFTARYECNLYKDMNAEEPTCKERAFLAGVSIYHFFSPPLKWLASLIEGIAMTILNLFSLPWSRNTTFYELGDSMVQSVFSAVRLAASPLEMLLELGKIIYFSACHSTSEHVEARHERSSVKQKDYDRLYKEGWLQPRLPCCKTERANDEGVQEPFIGPGRE